MRAGVVVGITGGARQVPWLVDKVGLDAAIDYKDTDVRAGLETPAPDGADVFFDYVAAGCRRGFWRVLPAARIVI